MPPAIPDEGKIGQESFSAAALAARALALAEGASRDNNDVLAIDNNTNDSELDIAFVKLNNQARENPLFLAL